MSADVAEIHKPFEINVTRCLSIHGGGDRGSNPGGDASVRRYLSFGDTELSLSHFGAAHLVSFSYPRAI